MEGIQWTRNTISDYEAGGPPTQKRKLKANFNFCNDIVTVFAAATLAFCCNRINYESN